jgi:hypothetical protein
VTRENYFSLSSRNGIEVIVLESSDEGVPDARESAGSPPISRIKVVWALFVEAVLVTALFVASVVISACISKAENVNGEASAQCESAGNWAAGNGGGLQISKAAWNPNGGVAIRTGGCAGIKGD